jgi:hypothetical protein
MPNIRDYNAEGLGLRATETGIDARANAGRRIANSFDDVAGALRQTGGQLGGGVKALGDAWVNYEDHKEISQGAPAAAQVFQGLQEQWNKIAKTADPNNTAVAGKFQEQVLEPALEQFQSAFNTEKSQEWAQERINHIRDHMTTKIHSDLSSMASNAVAVNAHQLMNSLSNSVRMDPSSLDFALDTLNHSVRAMVKTSPNLLPDHATEIETKLGQEMKENIVKSAIWGAIEKNPEAGVKMASDPRYSKYISGQEVTQAEQYAKMQKSAALTDEERQRTLQDRKAREDSKKQQNDILTKLGSDKPEDVASVTAKGILEDKTMTPEDKLTMFRFVQQESKPETDAKASSRAYNDVLPRLYAPPGDPQKITDINQLVEMKDKLTRTDFNDLMKKFQDSTTDTGQKVTVMKQQLSNAVKGSILHVAGMSADNDEGLYRFNRYVDDKVAEYQRDNKDVSKLFTPGSPEYLASPAALAPFKKSMAQMMDDKISDISGKTSKGPPPLPTGAPRGAQMMQDAKGNYHAYMQNAGKWQIWEAE